MTHLICSSLDGMQDWTALGEKGLADAQSFLQRRPLAGDK